MRDFNVYTSLRTRRHTFPIHGAMFKNTYQVGFISILYSIGSRPLEIWGQHVRNGHIKRITDCDLQSLVLELRGTNISTTFICCPAEQAETLGIKLPFIVMIVKNMNKPFTFEVQVLDDKNVQRRFRSSNYHHVTRVSHSICTMPMKLDSGWNQIQFNLADFTRRAYGTNYIETTRIQVSSLSFSLSLSFFLSFFLCVCISLFKSNLSIYLSGTIRLSSFFRDGV